ncbi:MAG: ABC transporter ATP-binding protein [Candidatus Eremiobacteraeota bacterium]|nr:ABC transporter ATP-binding protein [Candidatus Eremiobacteraeota bacterium]
MSLISIQHLRKLYGKSRAVDDFSVEIPKGCVFGLLGPNGSGKTTTFKCLLCLARPTSGTITFDGKPLAPSDFESIGYVPERSVLYEWMTVAQHLEMQRRAFKRYNSKRANELLELFALDPKKRVRAMSKGMRTALAVVMAFSIEPELLILDEPTSGLDPVNQRAVLNLIVGASAGGSTIVFSSHQIGQVERAAEAIAVLQNGKLILKGLVDDLKAEQKIVEGIFETDQFSLNGLSGDPRITRVERAGRILRLSVRDGSAEFSQKLAAMGASNVRTVDLNLEDIFLNAVDPTAHAGGIIEVR